MRVLVRAYDLDLLRGTGVTIRAVARYLTESGETVWATNSAVSYGEVERWAPDVIVAQERATDEASAWATRLQVPFVMLVHGPNEYETFLPQCDLVAFNTRLQQELAAESIVDTPSMVLHPPVFPADYETQGRGESITLIAFDHKSRKGFGTTLELARSLPEQHFLVVTDDTVSGAPPNVEFEAVTSDVRAIYARTKLLLMPSEEETYGRVAIEAAMSGIPVIASDLPGIREATDGDATLVAPGERWEDAVRQVLRDLETHRARARELARRREPSAELAAFRTRLEDMAAQGRRRPTLTLCMTVLNEAPTLERAIQSVMPAVDEIIVGVDERSQDESLDIARRLATQTFTFRETSPPDFARMRNRALEMVRADWAIVLDGHEWIEHPERIRPALETTAWSIEVRMLFEPDEQQIPALSYCYPKIHRRGVRFVGPSIHEEVSTPMERRVLAPEIAVWHERKPGHAANSRAREKTGTELDVLRAAWENGRDRRALFYLANGLREAGRHAEAIRAYEEYLRNPGWEEEGWQARLFLARCHAASRNWQAAKKAYERAIVQWPERAEALVGLGDTLLELGEPEASATWFRVAATLKEPENARLFVEVPAYRWKPWHGLALSLWRLGDRAGAVRAERHALRSGAGDWAQQNIDRWLGGGAERWGQLFDLSIRAHETGDREAGNEACERLLAMTRLPEDVREQTRRNQVFYAMVISDLVPSAKVRDVRFEVPHAWSRFNPSIAVDGDGYRAIVRSSNYTVDSSMYYRVHDVAEIVRTTNYLVDLGDDLAVRRVQPIQDATQGKRFPFPVTGFEDCRLFQHQSRWWVTATVRDRNAEGICQMALLELDGDAFRNLRLLNDVSSSQQHEKNWVPVVGPDELLLLRSCSPTVVVRYDAHTMRVEEVLRRPGPVQARSFRGSSQAVQVDTGWLLIVHESVDFEDRSRVVPHRFVLLSPDFALTHMSRQFFFLERSLEFCTGLAKKDGTLVAGFGSQDREAYVVTMRLEEVLSTLAAVRV